MNVHCLIVSPRSAMHPRARGLLADAHALGLSGVERLECHDLFFVEGQVTNTDLGRLAVELLSDPIAQTSHWRNEHRDGVLSFKDHVVEVALRPGVTDAVAEQVVRGAHVLGIGGVRRAATGQRYVVQGDLSAPQLHTLARRLLANDVIQRYALGEIEPVFPQPADASGQVELIPLRELDDDELLCLSRSRRAALDLTEMRAIQAYYRSNGRDPTDVELETIAQTWSEHCAHKTFKARIAIDHGQGEAPSVINGILNTFIRAATRQIEKPWVRSAFVDNAGIVDFDDEYEVSFKVETHNHPSAIEPFGGANTGVGGVIRDILGVSARPLALTDVLCFGPQALDPERLPDGVLHPRRIRSGVVAGIQDYGNKIGVPTVSGAILYADGYTANPLVFCGCVGIAPKGKHPRGPQPGDRIIVLGGRTGRDGLRGATFSSQTMDAQTGEVAGASVQIGDPIVEKGLVEVIVRARDAGLYQAITDCGAGGFSSAVGEMAWQAGADVELRHVRLKYPGLAPWEIWLSEAQERMVLAVPAKHVPALAKLCETFDVELTDIGAFTDSGRLVVRYGERVALDLANDFLHEGLPQRELVARAPACIGGARDAHPPNLSHFAGEEFPPALPQSGQLSAPGGGCEVADLGQVLLALLAHPNIASKAGVIRIYDHEVQGGMVVKPLTGAQNDGPSDAVVIKPLGTRGTRGVVLSCGINPEFGKYDAYRMAVSVVDEAVRNAVAAGANPERIALLDNFCWGDPTNPETLGTLVAAARGCHDAALHYGTPFISGKDSLNNEYLGADGRRHAIPPTLLISALGIIDDVNKAVTMDLKEAGNVIYFAATGLKTFGGSHVDLVAPSLSAGYATGPDDPHTLLPPALPEQSPILYRALHKAMTEGLVRACHDCSEGGLAVAAAEMCIAGRLGMQLELDVGEWIYFIEENGSFLVEVRPGDCAAFEACFSDLRGGLIGKSGFVTTEARLEIRSEDRPISLPVDQLVAAWQSIDSAADSR